MQVFAHGVGRVYHSPLPLALYVGGAAAAVALAFVARLATSAAPPRPARRLGDGRVLRSALRAAGLAGLLLVFATAVIVPVPGFTPTPLLFWVGLVATAALSAICAGVWAQAEPWATVEELIGAGTPPAAEARAPVDDHPVVSDGRTHELPPRGRVALVEDGSGTALPWWAGAVGVYALFWFELVSGVAFQPAGVLAAVLALGVASLWLRPRLGSAWRQADPLSILFGFAGRLAPFEVCDDCLRLRARPRIDAREIMHPSLFAALFVLLAGTTLDNLRETVAWFGWLTATGLDAAPSRVVDSAALALLGAPFAAAWLAAMLAARRALRYRGGVVELARRFAGSLVPVGVGYFLAHNASLVLTGVPALGAELTGGRFATVGAAVPPALVWWLEIALVVGGHVAGVLAAHRIAVAAAGRGGRVVAGELATTALMTLFTAVTLWLLAQPLVAAG